MSASARKIVAALLEAQLSAEELQEIWQDDQAGEYVQINDDDSAYHVAHGKAMEQIAPGGSDQRVKRPSGFAKFREEPVDVPFDNTLRLIREWMKKNEFFPNIWRVNDHGNVELYSSTGEALGGLV